MHTLYKYIIPVIVCSVYSCLQISCASLSPEWIDQQPINNNYWHGIGYASSELENHREVSRERAIHEVSSQIKINVNSQLDIVVNDFNGSVENTISSMMSSRVSLLLPELEFVDHYKTKNGVYSYVRLHKEKYKRALEKLRENSISTALRFIEEADEQFSVNSLILIQKAWNEFLPFNDEPVKVVYEGKKTNLYTLIKEKINYFSNRVTITASTKKKEFITFVDYNSVLLFNVEDSFTKKPMPSVPIKMMLNNMDYSLISDSKGIAQFSLPQMTSPYIFTANYQLDIKKLFEQNMPLNQILPSNPKVSTISIKVRRAKGIIRSSEMNLNKPIDNLILKPAIKRFFKDNVDFVLDEPEIQILIESNTIKKANRVDENFPYFMYGNASVSLQNMATKEEFFNSSISGVKGADFNSQYTAGIRSYDAMTKQIVSQLQDELFMDTGN
tara:strand:+ start:2004 stop:3332 length:1329 start_codon:yes stop_codon:yes gene_type:complete